MENELREQLERIEEKLDELTHYNDWEWNTLGRLEQKLDRIIAYIDKVESPKYQQALDNKEILINLLANAVITKLFAMFNNGQNQ